MAEVVAKVIIENAGANKLAGAIGGGGSGGGSGLAGLVGGGGSGLAAGAVAGAVAAGVSKLLGVAKQIGQTLVKVSPHLQATMNILQKSFELALRPIADVVSLFLRPFAISFLRFVVPIYRRWREFFGEKGEESKERVGEITDAVKDAFSGGVGGVIGGSQNVKDTVDAIGDANSWFDKLTTTVKGWVNMGKVALGVWEALQGVAKVLAGAFLLFHSILEPILKDFEPVYSFLADLVLLVGTAINGIGSAFLQLVQGDFAGAVETMKELFAELWDGLLLSFSLFGRNLAKRWKERWDSLSDIASSVWGSIADVITGVWDFIKDGIISVVDSISNALNTLSDKARNLLPKILGGGNSTSVGDALITKTGQIIHLDPNDNVLAFKGSSPPGRGGGGSANITININALDASSITSSVIDKITREIELKLRRGFSARTTEVLGI